jgi:hypothetical protein
MPLLTSEQRADLFCQAAIRTGIHQPLLAALHTVHPEPKLADGETGLGISPANQVPLEVISTIAGQVHYAANTICSLSQSLTAQGWSGANFWSSEQGRYSDKFLRIVASGFLSDSAPTSAASSTAPIAYLLGARLEYADFDDLRDAYLQHVAMEMRSTGIPANQSFIEPALRNFVEPLPSHYFRLSYQRTALLELARLWHQLNTHSDAIAHLAKTDPAIHDDLTLDSALLRFLQNASATYTGLPHQREAFLRLVQSWQQLSSRSATLLALQAAILPTLETHWLDTALIAFIQRLPRVYTAQGNQRNALVESYRQWHQLESRPATLIALGVSPDLFTGTPSPADISQAAAQADRALIAFFRQLPTVYAATPHQREALIYLTQLWRDLSTSAQATQSLIDDFQQLETARRDSVTAPLPPRSLPPTLLPTEWTVYSIQPHSAIALNSSFTWAMATQGGLALPPNQPCVDAIVAMAGQLQTVRDRLNCPLTIVRWYALPTRDSTREPGRFAGDRHSLGDGVLFYCDGLTGKQVYWFLDPDWAGGLGYDDRFPALCYLDGRRDRVRWITF